MTFEETLHSLVDLRREVARRSRHAAWVVEQHINAAVAGGFAGDWFLSAAEAAAGRAFDRDAAASKEQG